MLCKKYIGYFTLFCLPLLFSCVFCSPVLAIEDLTGEISFDGDNTPPVTQEIICSSNCSDYKYLIVETDLDFNPAVTSNARVDFGFLRANNSSMQTHGFYLREPFAIVDISVYMANPNIVKISAGQGAGQLNSGISGKLKWTLTDNYSSCSCPDPEPCPEIPENPYDQKLDNITQAIYIASATLLVIYFFYCIYRLIIKNSGVK